MNTTLQVDLVDLPDLTDTLQQGKKRIVGHGSFGIVYHCFGTRSGEVSMFTLTSLKVLPMFPVSRLQSRLLPSFMATTKMKRMCSCGWVNNDIPPYILLTSDAIIENDARAWNMEKIGPSEHCPPLWDGTRRRLRI